MNEITRLRFNDETMAISSIGVVSVILFVLLCFLHYLFPGACGNPIVTFLLADATGKDFLQKNCK